MRPNLILPMFLASTAMGRSTIQHYSSLPRIINTRTTRKSRPVFGYPKRNIDTIALSIRGGQQESSSASTSKTRRRQKGSKSSSSGGSRSSSGTTSGGSRRRKKKSSGEISKAISDDPAQMMGDAIRYVLHDL